MLSFTFEFNLTEKLYKNRFGNTNLVLFVINTLCILLAKYIVDKVNQVNPRRHSLEHIEPFERLKPL